MMIKLTFENGYGIYNEEGKMLEFVEKNGHFLDENDGCPNNVGIWDEDAKETIPWSDVVTLIKEGVYKLSAWAYLDNGQVVDEGKILSLKVLKGAKRAKRRGSK
jgi:hypothetical protein